MDVCKEREIRDDEILILLSVKLQTAEVTMNVRRK